MGSRPIVQPGDVAVGTAASGPGMGRRRVAIELAIAGLSPTLRSALLRARATFDGRRSIDRLEPRVASATVAALRRKGYVKGHHLTRAGLALREALVEQRGS